MLCCEPNASLLVHRCNAPPIIRPPALTPLPALFSIIYCSLCGNFMFVSMETDTRGRMDAFMYFSFCFWREGVCSFFFHLVVARSDWIVYVGRAAGRETHWKKKKNTQRAFFPLICPQTLSLRHLDPGCKQLKCFAPEQAGLCAETESCLWGWRSPLWTNPIGCV